MPWRWPWYRSPGLPDKTAPRHPLREFVYLDEVSVYSLLASRSGPVPTDFTDTESESLQDEISGTLSLGVPGTKSEVRGRSETATSSSSQIVRKSSAQARFKQFLEAEQIDFVFSAAPEASAAYNPTAIQRGNLFEMQVELDADETFQISTTIASLVEILTQNAVQFQAFVDRAEVEQVLAFNRILERLLVGLVPIKAKAVDYVVVQHDGAPRIIQRSTLDSLPLAACAAEPLYVVGFTQQDLFWKDLRTVLFGHHRYVLTGRLAVSDIQTQWSPVKLAEVLRSFLPELADQLDEVGRGFGTAIRASVRSAEQSAHDSTLHDALIDFGMRITTIPATTDELHNLLADWHPPGDAEILDGTLEQTRRAFASVVDLFRDRVGDAGIDDTQIARHRSDVIVEYGLPPAPARSVAPAAPHLEPEINNGWYLETEVIALYW